MRVRVKDWGKKYTTFNNWLIRNDCIEYLKQYMQEEQLYDHLGDYGGKFYPLDKNNKEVDMTNITYEVLKENYHTGNSGIMLYLILEPITNKIYLINKDGTEEVK